VNRHLRNALSWAGMALTVWGIVLLVPDWFGRPSSAWWLIGAGTALGLVVGVFSFVGFVSLAAGLAIVATAIVRSVAFSDSGALPLGFLCLVVGGLVGILLIGAAIRLLTPRPADSED
jgi:hypothetical protein